MSYGNRPTAIGGPGGGPNLFIIQFNNNVTDATPDGWLDGGYYVNGGTTSNPAIPDLANPKLIRRAQAWNHAIFIGSDRGLNSRSWSGTIAEVVFLNEAAPEDLLKVEGYLMWKWGMQILLPEAHAHADAAPQSSIIVPEPASLAMGLMVSRRRR